MELETETTEKLRRWLDEAAPAQRCYFLTRLGRLPPRALGAELFAELLAAGRPADALRLLRHAVALSDEEVEALAQRHLVEAQAGGGAALAGGWGRAPALGSWLPQSCTSWDVERISLGSHWISLSPCHGCLPICCPQGADQRVPTWARQAWKALALARPALCLALLRTLWDKVQAAGEEGPSQRRYSPLLMVSAALFQGRWRCGCSCLRLLPCCSLCLPAGSSPSLPCQQPCSPPTSPCLGLPCCAQLRRAVVTLFHGAVGAEAAAALLPSEAEYRRKLERCGCWPLCPIDRRLLRHSLDSEPAFAW